MKNKDRIKNIKHWATILSVLALSVVSTNLNPNLLKTSVIIQESPAFDGTVYPIQEVPDWTNTTSTERNMNYHNFPVAKLISAPVYRNDYFTFPSASLVWGNKEHNVIRNTKITYPVPYAGSYALDDGGENQGSHPAVDIKALAGTPIHAIANAIVYKVGLQSGGFGNYVILQHNNVPSPDSPDTKVTLYSGYAHMTKSFVTEGQIIYKNDIIGEVGTTGASTTNHLHFQLDSSLAPWHLYWPFTNADAKAAGVNFWEAVSEGVGKDNVYKYTFNPFKWVIANLNTSSSSAPITIQTQSVEATPVITPVFTPVPTVEAPMTVEVPVVQAPEIQNTVVKVGFDNLNVNGTFFVMIGNNQDFTVNLLDSSGNTINSASFDGEIAVSISDTDLAQVSPSSLTASDFVDGVATLKVYANREGNIKLNFDIAGDRYESQAISLISQVKPFARFGIFTDGTFSPKVPETIQIMALDENGNPTPSFNAGGKIRLSTLSEKGTFSKDILTSDDFESGVAEVQYTGEDENEVVIQSTYGMAKAKSQVMQSKLFSDLSFDNDYYDAVTYLFKKGTVQGYPDGTFQDTKTVSRIEALKFIYSGFDKSTIENLTVSYKDAFNGQWYSNYVASASSEGIIQGYADGTLKPEQGVNRVEFIKMLTKALAISVDPVVSEDPYNDVDMLSWYAPYAQFAKSKNIFPLNGSDFEPGLAMNRGEVAEVIYRMIMVQENNGEKYSVLLKPGN